MASPVLFLAYGNRRLEVLSGAGFDSVCHQAEATLSLHPQSYEIHDACGKVDADSFDRSLASRGLCVLELREKPEWQKMRQMEVQIQQILERSSEAEIKAEVERQVAAHVDAAMGRLKAELRKDLDGGKMEELEDGTSLVSRVAVLETELAEHVIDSSADLGRLEAGLVTAQRELQELRSFTADQLSHLEHLEQQNHQHLEQDLEKMQNITKDISKAMKGLKDMEDMEGVKMKMCNMTQNVDELSEKMAAMEIDLNEQAITASAVNGHLESGVATAKQELESLRHCMAEQLNFVNAKMEHFHEERPKAGPLGPVQAASIAWSDGFKSHELSVPAMPAVPAVDGPLYGKMGKALWKSAPALTSLTTLKRASKSLAQLPPL